MNFRRERERSNHLLLVMLFVRHSKHVCLCTFAYSLLLEDKVAG